MVPDPSSAKRNRAIYPAVVVLLAEAFPLLVALVGAAFWMFNIPATQWPLIPVSAAAGKYLGKAVVVTLIWPVYFVSGVGWFMIGRPRVGGITLAVHSATALLTITYGSLLVFGAGDFGGPTHNAPFVEFYASLAVSLAVSVLSTMSLVVTVLRDRTQFQ